MRWKGPTWLPWAGLITCLLATLLAQGALRISAQRLHRQAFEKQAHEVRARISERLRDYELILLGGRGLFYASNSVERGEWRAFVTALDLERTRPGIQGVGYAQWVPAADLDRHIQEVRKEGFPAFTVRPPGPRDTYTSIVFLEPFNERNQRAFGFDMWSEPTRRAALAEARDQGRTAISGRVTLVQETSQDIQHGFLMYVPVYRSRGVPGDLQDRRAELRGWVYSAFRMKDFMGGLLPPELSGLRVEVFDGGKADPALAMYAERPAGPSPRGSHSLDLTYDFEGHAWHIRVVSDPAFDAGVDLSSARLTLALGSLISLLLFGVLHTLARTSQRAEALAQDMTLALREEKGRVQGLLDASAEGIFGMDLDGRCTFANPSCAHLLGIEDPQQLLGLSMYQTLRPVYADGSPCEPKDCPLLGGLVEGAEGHLSDAFFHRQDGSRFWVEANSYPVRRGGVLEGALVTFLDVSLERESERLKHEFVSVVSHELRTPLTSIRGTIGILRGTLMADVPEEERRHLLEIAYRNCERLVLLINDILDLEKIRSGRLRLQLGPVALGAFLAEAVEANRSYGGPFGTTFVLEAPVADALVVADASRLMQVMNNLMSNAAKFGPEGGTVHLRALPDPKGMRVEVRDEGPGIPAEFQARIFQAFSQAESPQTRKRGGSGLGLTISRSLVEGMGGHLGFHSEPGQGTTFHFTLPRFVPDAL